MGMTVGFVILAHSDLGRVGQLVKSLSKQGAPVCVHIDKKTPLAVYKSFVKEAEGGNVSFAPRVRCEWGMFNIVRATQNAAEMLLKNHADISHVYLLSGSCLPTRPIKFLNQFLKDNPDTDFIESIHLGEERWVKGGLSDERFDYFFPIGWRKNPRLFEVLVGAQRLLGLKRKIPKNTLPYIGSQWWCLQRKTLVKMFSHKDRASFEKYFKWALIPDESYFQTLVRRYSKNIKSESLTLSVFDGQGRPALLYDDQLDYIMASDAFFVRKVWPKANKLYNKLLNPKLIPPLRGNTSELSLKSKLEHAAKYEDVASPGVLNMGSYKTGERRIQNVTPGPYIVLSGFGSVFHKTPEWMSSRFDLLSHGSLFAKQRPEFADGAELLSGNVSANKKIRNRNPSGFLSNVLRTSSDRKHCFLYDSNDQPRIRGVLAKDPNASIFAIEGAWLVQLMELNLSGNKLLVAGQRLSRLERNLHRIYHEGDISNDLTIYSIMDFVTDPAKALGVFENDISAMAKNLGVKPPIMADLKRIPALIQRLKGQGMKLELDHRSQNNTAPILVSSQDEASLKQMK
jgi:hypothetical protein